MNILWRRAPLLLLRHYRQLASALAISAAFLLAASLAAPAFVASVETASFRSELAKIGRWGAGLRISLAAGFLDYYTDTEDADFSLQGLGRNVSGALDEDVAPEVGVDPTITTYLGAPISAAGPRESVPARLVHRTHDLDHVTPAEVGDDSGIWIPDTIARQLSVAPGDEIRLASSRGSASVPIAATYRFLPHDRERPYWSPLNEYIFREASDDTYPPAFIFMDDALFFDLADRLGDLLEIGWEIPLADSVNSLGEAARVNRVFGQLQNEAGSPSSSLGALLEQEIRITWGRRPSVQHVLGDVIQTTTERVESVTPPLEVLSLAGRVVALGMLIAVGFYLVRRREVEVAFLLTRGTPPTSIAMRAIIEACLPYVVGAAGGAALALLCVRALGPTADFELSRATEDGTELGLSALVGLVALGVSAGVAARRQEIAMSGRPRSPLGWVPSSLLVGAGVASTAVYLRVRETGEAAPWTAPSMLMPVVLVFGGAVVGAALIRAGLLPLRGGSKNARPPFYLAMRRMVAAPVMLQVLVAAAAFALGVMFYGVTLEASVERTAQAKAKVFVGSDLMARVPANSEAPRLPMPVTHVTRVDRAATDNGARLKLLGIDTDSFAAAAYWDPTFSDRPLGELLRDLGAGSDDSPRAIAVAAGEVESVTVGASDGDVTVRIVDSIDVFPGMSEHTPMLVLAEPALRDILGRVGGSVSIPTEELWVKGDEQAIEDALRRTGRPYFSTVTADAVVATSALQSMLWTLGLLAALGATAGLVSIVALLLYLQARQRSAIISTALTRRMGFARGHEYAAWLWEIAVAALGAVAVATAAGLTVAAAMNDRFDLRPTLLPPPILVVPAAAIVVTVAAALLISAGLAWRIQRMVDRADIAQVLRT